MEKYRTYSKKFLLDLLVNDPKKFYKCAFDHNKTKHAPFWPGPDMQDLDLSNLVIKNAELGTVSFNGSNLLNAVFYNCSFELTMFDGCKNAGTAILVDCRTPYLAFFDSNPDKKLPKNMKPKILTAEKYAKELRSEGKTIPLWLGPLSPDKDLVDLLKTDVTKFNTDRKAKEDWRGKINLRKVNLSGLDISGANLMNADLDGAIFRGADVSGTVFYRAQVKKADFRGAKNIRSAIFVDTDSLESAIFDGETPENQPLRLYAGNLFAQGGTLPAWLIADPAVL